MPCISFPYVIALVSISNASIVFPILCWTEVMKVGIFALFLYLRGKSFHLSSLNMTLAIHIWPFWYWGNFLLFWVCWILFFFHTRVLDLPNALSVTIERIVVWYFPHFINCFSYVKPSLHSRNKSYLVMFYNLL